MKTTNNQHLMDITRSVVDTVSYTFGQPSVKLKPCRWLYQDFFNTFDWLEENTSARFEKAFDLEHEQSLHLVYDDESDLFTLQTQIPIRDEMFDEMDYETVSKPVELNFTEKSFVLDFIKVNPDWIQQVRNDTRQRIGEVIKEYDMYLFVESFDNGEYLAFWNTRKFSGGIAIQIEDVNIPDSPLNIHFIGAWNIHDMRKTS